MKFLQDGASRQQTSSIKLSKENQSIGSASTAPKKSKPTPGSKTTRSTTCWTARSLRRSCLRTKTISTRSTQTTTGRTTTPNKWKKTHCSCRGRLCRRSSTATTTTTRLRRWAEPPAAWLAPTRRASTRGWSRRARRGARQRRTRSSTPRLLSAEGQQINQCLELTTQSN